MMRVAIIDDEPLARAGVRARLASHAGIDVVAEYEDGMAALTGLQAQPVDLAFVDVCMPVLDGLALLARLPPVKRPLSILLTAHDGFAVRAFELRAVDYLLKPIDDQRFDEALVRACEWRALHEATVLRPAATMHAPAHFRIRVGQRVRVVGEAQVDWIEADGDYARLHVAGEAHLVRESLHRLMSRLDPTAFIRVHRSAIVRLALVDELQPLSNRDALLRLRNGTPVRASRTYIDALMARLADTR